MSTPTTAFARALDQLGRAIVSGELPTGHADTVDGLVSRTGASRSVVREVTRVLTSLGMLSAGRRVGLRVLGPEQWNTLDAQVVRWRLAGPDAACQLAELRALRLAIEPAAAAQAARVAGAAREPSGAGVREVGADEAAGATGETEAEPASGLAMLQAAAAALNAAASDPDPTAFLEADRALHTAVLDLSGNAMFIRLGAVIEEGLRNRALHERAGLVPEPHDLDLHLEVARAIGAGESVAAGEAMRRIIERTQP